LIVYSRSVNGYQLTVAFIFSDFYEGLNVRKGVMRIMAKTAAMVIAAKGFRDEEYQIPKAILEKAGVRVVTVSTTLTEAVGKLGLRVIPDRLLKQLTVDDADVILFVGGGGSEQYFDDPIAHRIAHEYAQNGKIVGAICIAPVILARAGLLAGKKATVFPDGQAALEQNGACYTGNPVEVDGLLITGNGPAAAAEFGRKTLELLLETGDGSFV
jgi:protease I